MTSDPRLLTFLADLAPLGTHSETWPSGSVLEISGYLTDQLPPNDLITGARAVVRRGDAVLAFEDPWGTHILPGGRLEPGEAAPDALVRELREEVGCVAAGAPTYVGFLRLHHVTPRPDLYPYPHPDSLQLIYVVETSDDVVADPNELLVLRPRFVPLSDVDGLPLSPAERAFLAVL